MQLAIEDLGTVLGVWAHPDDGAYLSAGTMAALRDAGHHVVVATCGESGTPDPERWAPAELAAVGRDELRARQWWSMEAFVAATPTALRTEAGASPAMAVSGDPR
jgi:LmbE family N-acetylglucosaminyl deacetylase